jgi:hypothetical protein
MEAKWLEIAHDMTPFLNGGSMWLWLLQFGMWHELRLGRVTKGKWRTPDGKVGEWSIFMFGAPKVVAHAYVD